MNTKIRVVREYFKISKKDISSLLNISTYKYNVYENDLNLIPSYIFMLLSKIYNIPIEMFVFPQYSCDEILKYLDKQYGNLDNKNIHSILYNNLFEKNIKSFSYHSVKKIYDRIQINTSNYIKQMLNEGFTKSEISHILNSGVESVDVLLKKRRFISIEELINLSKFRKIEMSKIIFPLN